MKASPNHGDERRGSAENPAEPRFLVVGRVTKPHGVRGEIRVEVHTDAPERFTWLERVYVGADRPQPVSVEGARFHKSWVLLKLAGYDSRESAMALRGQWLQVPTEEAIPLEEGEYYLYQLIGLAVYAAEPDEAKGESDLRYLGELTDVLETKANNVFVIEGPLGEVLLPDIEDVVDEIDFEMGRMIVRLLPGLLPES